MTWSKLDDGFWSHPKVVNAGNEAVGVYARALSYCGRHETDGYIPPEVAGFIGSKRAFQRLIDTDLIHENGSGFFIPDFTEFNPSHALLEAKRAKDRARKAEGIRDDSEEIP
jgi:hypothetical protein